VVFKLAKGAGEIEVYTTRPDTLFGATYMVLSPEHPLVAKITTKAQAKTVKAYGESAARKSDLERTDLAKEKTGVFTGAYAVNPVNGKKIPVWISDYILISYGTGAIMAVPGHDERDFEFAKKFDLPIVQVVSKDGTRYELAAAEPEEGVAVNSGEFDGLATAEFKQRITEWLEKRGIGRKAVNFKLRDWIFSRQRYWGEPIPLVHCPTCGVVPIPYDQLPLRLPEVTTYKPTGTGESPLALMKDWVETTCPKCGGPAKRETNTMPQWAGSCWYYLRYLDPKNDRALAARDKVDYWMPVNLYVGGAEHAVLHLLYARFWHKVLFDIGVVNTDEPFMRLINQGMILGEGGVKMSKSLGNVINPDDIVAEYGADAMRVYEMFMGPLEVSKPWSTNGIAGVRRFLDRVWRLGELPLTDDAPNSAQLRLLHQTVRTVSQDTSRLDFNTAISQLMIFVNETTALDRMPRALWEPFLLLLSPYAPHLAEELWEKAGKPASVARQAWPAWDEVLAKDDVLEIVFQVNGKVRARVELPAGLGEGELSAKALENDRVRQFTEGKTVRKVIVVPDRLVNIVAN
jgi:leucyl-tRNA synthetase